MDNPTHRVCTLCHKLKPLEAFGPMRGGKYGRRPSCRICKRAYDLALLKTEKGRARNAAAGRAYYRRWGKGGKPKPSAD